MTLRFAISSQAGAEQTWVCVVILGYHSVLSQIAEVATSNRGLYSGSTPLHPSAAEGSYGARGTQ